MTHEITAEEAVEIIDMIESIVEQHEIDGDMEREKQALTMAIQALEQARWIPVSERLPHNHEEVIVTCRVGKETYVDKAWFVSTKEKHRFFGTDNEVIAWMPLPQPYKAESEEEK